MQADSTEFAGRLLAWFDEHGRHDLPWQHPRSPYRVWVAEIMLQQTQVATVIDYYQRFMRRFPDIPALAAASQDEVLEAWAGLGYYSRARNLHRAARCIATQHAGRFPERFAEVVALPGIGESTAGAILAQAFGQRHAIVDGNVRRVLCRYYAIDGWPGRSAVNRQLWERARGLLPHDRLADYTQAIMDLGATLCTRSKPACDKCPLQAGCRARALGCVDDLPSPRPRRDRPVRDIRVLLIRRGDGAVLLERRPPTGVWGGLYSLPELAATASPQEDCRLRWGLRVALDNELPVLQHALTHFEMRLHPLSLQVLGDGEAVLESDGLLWYNPGQPPPGLPRPIQALMKRLKP